MMFPNTVMIFSLICCTVHASVSMQVLTYANNIHECRPRLKLANFQHYNYSCASILLSLQNMYGSISKKLHTWHVRYDNNKRDCL